ncbi:LPXTG cell wall anchor domain-containing protein [Agrilactobacillus yilanensis]|uniref:LPXTG cell wall anchor domain-containing protein n=1 Tax=Agrilactobacillus yilanensis TaxID=2485997 RepID=A0ABW4J609_9LACO|nr:LPXTG cell wall anchor domain-containing protein [Agrilactobacillus yilanensis]
MTKKEMRKQRLLKGVTFGLLSFAALLDLFGINQKDKVYADTQEPTDGQDNSDANTVTNEQETLKTQNNLAISTEDTTSEAAPEVATTPETETTGDTVGDAEVPSSEVTVENNDSVESEPEPITPETPAAAEEETVTDGDVSQETLQPQTATPEVGTQTTETQTPAGNTEAAGTETSEKTNDEPTNEITGIQSQEQQPAALAEEISADTVEAEAEDTAYTLVNANNDSSLHDLYISYLQSTGITDADQLAQLAARVPETMNITEGTVLQAIAIGGTVYLPVLTDSDVDAYMRSLLINNVDNLNLTITQSRLTDLKNNQIKYVALNTVVPNDDNKSNVSYIGDTINNDRLGGATASTDTLIVRGIEITRTGDNSSQSVAWKRNSDGTVDTKNLELLNSDIQFGNQYNSDGKVQAITPQADDEVNYQWILDNFSANGASIQVATTDNNGKLHYGYAGINSFDTDKMILTVDMFVADTDKTMSSFAKDFLDGLANSTNPTQQYLGVLRDGVGNIIRYHLEGFQTDNITVDTTKYENQSNVTLEVMPDNEQIKTDIKAIGTKNFGVDDQSGAVTKVVQGTGIVEGSSSEKKDGSLDVTLSKAAVTDDNSLQLNLLNYYYTVNFNLLGQVKYQQAVKDSDGTITTTDLSEKDNATVGSEITSEQPATPENTHVNETENLKNPTTVGWGTTTVTYNYDANLNASQKSNVTTQTGNLTVAVTATDENSTEFSEFANQDLTDTDKFTVSSEDANFGGITATDKGFQVTFKDEATDATGHVITVQNKATGTSYTLDLTLQGQVKYQTQLDDKEPVAIDDATTTENLGATIDLDVHQPAAADPGTHYVNTTTTPDNATTFTWGTTTVTYNYETDHMVSQNKTINTGDTSQVTGHTINLKTSGLDLSNFTGDILGENTNYEVTEYDDNNTVLNNITGIVATDKGFDMTFAADTTTSKHVIVIRNKTNGETYQLNLTLQGQVRYQKQLDNYTPTAIGSAAAVAELGESINIDERKPDSIEQGYHFVETTAISEAGNPETTFTWGTSMVTYKYAKDAVVSQSETVDTTGNDTYKIYIEATDKDALTQFIGQSSETNQTGYSLTKGANITQVDVQDNGFEITFAADTGGIGTFSIRNDVSGETYTVSVSLQARIQYRNEFLNSDGTFEKTTSAGSISKANMNGGYDVNFKKSPQMGYTFVKTTLDPERSLSGSGNTISFRPAWGTTTVTYTFLADYKTAQNTAIHTWENDDHTVAITPTNTEAPDQTVKMDSFINGGNNLIGADDFTISGNTDQAITGVTADENGFHVTFKDDVDTAAHTITIHNNTNGDTHTLNLTLQGQVKYQTQLDDKEPVAIDDATTTGDLGTTIGLDAHQPAAADSGTHYVSTTTDPTAATTFTWGTTTVTDKYASDHSVDEEKTINTADTTETTDHTVTVTADKALNMNDFTGQDLTTDNFTITKGTDVKDITATETGFNVTFADNTTAPTHSISIRNNTTGETYNLMLNLQGQVNYQTNVNGTITALPDTTEVENLGTSITDPEKHQLATLPEGTHYVDTTLDPAAANAFTWGTTTITYNYVSDNAVTQTETINTATDDRVTDHEISVTADSKLDMNDFTGQDLMNETNFDLTKSDAISGIIATETGFKVTFNNDTTAANHTINIRNKTTGETYNLTLTLQGQVEYKTNVNGTITALPNTTEVENLGTSITDPEQHQLTTLPEGTHYVDTTLDPAAADTFTWGTTTITYNYAADNVVTQTETINTAETTDHTITVTADEALNMKDFTGQDLTTDDFTVTKGDDVKDITATADGFNVTFDNDTTAPTHNISIRNNTTGETYNLTLNLQGQVNYQTNVNGTITDIETTSAVVGNLGTALTDAVKNQYKPEIPPVSGTSFDNITTTNDNFVWGTTTVTYNYTDGETYTQTKGVNVNVTAGDGYRVDGHVITIKSDNSEKFQNFANQDFASRAGSYTIDTSANITNVRTDGENFIITFDNNTQTAGRSILITNNQTGEKYKLDTTLKANVTHYTELNGDKQQVGDVVERNLGEGNKPQIAAPNLGGNTYLRSTEASPSNLIAWRDSNQIIFHYAENQEITQNVTVNTADPKQVTGHVVTVDSQEITGFDKFANQSNLEKNPDFKVTKDDQVQKVNTTATGFEITFDPKTDTAVHEIKVVGADATYTLTVTLTGEVNYEVTWPDGTSQLVTDPSQIDKGLYIIGGDLSNSLPGQTIDDAFVKAHGDAAVQEMLASGKYQLKAVTPAPETMEFTWGTQTIQIQYQTPDVTNPDTGVEIPVTPDRPNPPVNPEKPVAPTDPEEPTKPEEPTDPEEPVTPDEPDEVIPDEDTDETVTNPNTGVEIPETPVQPETPTRPANGTAGLTQVATQTTAKKAPATNQGTLPQTGEDKVESSTLSALGTLGLLGLFGGKIALRKRKED